MAVPSGSRNSVLSVYLSASGTWASYALLIVVLPFRFQELGLSVVEYGTALAVYGLGTLVTEAAWGYLAFRIGSPAALGAVGLATALSMVALAFARTFAELAVLLGIYGALVVYSTPLIRWIGMTSLGPGTAGRGLGRLGLFFGIGISVGTAAGPLVFLAGGFAANVAIGTVVFAISTVPLLRVPWRSMNLPAARPRVGRSLKALLERGFVLATVLVVLYFMTYTLVTNFLQYYSIDLFHGSPTGAGYVIGGARGATLVSGLVLGGIADRRRSGTGALVGFFLLGAGAFGTWLSGSFAEMTAFTLVMAAGAGWLSVTLLPMALARVPAENQGTAVGVFGSFEDLGLVIGPALLGVVYAGWGPRALFPVAALVALGAGLVAFGGLCSRAGRAFPTSSAEGEGGPLPRGDPPARAP